MIRQYLDQPYPQVENRWKLIVLISLFVSIFMFVFQPFGLSQFRSAYKPLILLGYGGVTFVVLVINIFGITSLLRRWFKLKTWTVKKQIIWLIWIVFTIGLGNYFYSTLRFSFWGWQSLVKFQIFTVLVGIIPIVVITIVEQNIKLKQNLSSAHEINQNIKPQSLTQKAEIVTIITDNKKDKFEIDISNLLYIESTGNYIEIFYELNDMVKKTLLRCTIKRIENQLSQYPNLFKCHRAYLVNTSKIVQVKGNSQGLKLLLKNSEVEIPVSRSLSNGLKSQLILH
jgi:DNA-binding LytR/AlgR family response regulator